MRTPLTSTTSTSKSRDRTNGQRVDVAVQAAREYQTHPERSLPGKDFVPQTRNPPLRLVAIQILHIRVGASFFYPRGAVHSIAAIALLTWIVDKDQPISTRVALCPIERKVEPPVLRILSAMGSVIAYC
jgi:hypothetical protein